MLHYIDEMSPSIFIKTFCIKKKKMPKTVHAQKVGDNITFRAIRPTIIIDIFFYLKQKLE